MIEKDIIQDTENEFEPFRIFILTNAVIALPLNLLVFYLIMFKSPKYLNKYKYILLNIWVWVFVTDMLLDVVVVPLPLMDIFSFYATGLVRYMDPSVGFGCYAFGVFCVSESLMSLLIAFFYRYRSLKYELQIFGKPVTMIHYCIGITFLLVVPPGTVGLGVVSTYVPSDHFQKYINKNRPDYMPFLEQRRVFGTNTRNFLIGCGVYFLWIIAWTFMVAWCIRGIMRQFKENRASLSDFTYRLHVQLLKSLIIQVIQEHQLVKAISLSLLLFSSFLLLFAKILQFSNLSSFLLLFAKIQYYQHTAVLFVRCASPLRLHQNQELTTVIPVYIYGIADFNYDNPRSIA